MNDIHPHHKIIQIDWLHKGFLLRAALTACFFVLWTLLIFGTGMAVGLVFAPNTMRIQNYNVDTVAEIPSSLPAGEDIILPQKSKKK